MVTDDLNELREEMGEIVRRIEYVTSVVWKIELLYLKISYLQNQDVWDSIKWDLREYQWALKNLGYVADSLEKLVSNLTNTEEEKVKV